MTPEEVQDVFVCLHNKFKAEFPNMYVEGKNTFVYSYYVMCLNALQRAFYLNTEIPYDVWYNRIDTAESISHWCIENLDMAGLGK